MSRAAKVARYCGPAAVASVLGISREQAAERLLEHEPRGRGWFHWTSVALAVGVPRSSFHLQAKVRVFVNKRTRPTLARWLREDGRNAIVLTTTHFVHVHGGEVVEDNGSPKRRAKVYAVIFLPRD